jgi:hypothetical protein
MGALFEALTNRGHNQTAQNSHPKQVFRNEINSGTDIHNKRAAFLFNLSSTGFHSGRLGLTVSFR